MGCHFLLQGIFPTQGLNLGLPHCRQILYRLSHHWYALQGEKEKSGGGDSLDINLETWDHLLKA